MQVVDFLAAVRPGIDHRPEAVAAACRARQFRHLQHHSSKHLPFAGAAIGQRVDMRLGNDQQVYRGLGMDIVEGHHVVVFVHLARRYLAGHDLAEDAIILNVHENFIAANPAPRRTGPARHQNC
ncbi:hypothetical protein D3C72_1938010 [compost metagenome]